MTYRVMNSCHYADILILRCVGDAAGWIGCFRMNYICRGGARLVLDVGGGGISYMVECSHVYVVVSIKISAKRRVCSSVSRLDA